MSVSPDETRAATTDSGHDARDVHRAPAWRRGLVAFGLFWWDFLVGDTPELLVGALVAMGSAALFVHGVGVRPVVVGALPVLVVGILIVSSLRARARIRARARSDGEN
ncbi:MAG TPA: hypothetical protein VN799_02315 [Acidimicrobiales bacterium]|nr:hypothetical protein [Acidimicrobiales bacterium]